jgi:hypothetical protein
MFDRYLNPELARPDMETKEFVLKATKIENNSSCPA